MGAGRNGHARRPATLPPPAALPHRAGAAGGTRHPTRAAAVGGHRVAVEKKGDAVTDRLVFQTTGRSRRGFLGSQNWLRPVREERARLDEPARLAGGRRWVWSPPASLLLLPRVHRLASSHHPWRPCRRGERGVMRGGLFPTPRLFLVFLERDGLRAAHLRPTQVPSPSAPLHAFSWLRLRPRPRLRRPAPRCPKHLHVWPTPSPTGARSPRFESCPAVPPLPVPGPLGSWYPRPSCRLVRKKKISLHFVNFIIRVRPATLCIEFFIRHRMMMITACAFGHVRMYVQALYKPRLALRDERRCARSSTTAAVPTLSQPNRDVCARACGSDVLHTRRRLQKLGSSTPHWPRRPRDGKRHQGAPGRP